MCFKKRTELSFSKPFVAAYSERPFKNAKNPIPDYRFDRVEGVYWALKVGEMQVGWGVGAKQFKAYGIVTVERQNKNWLSLDTKGLPFRQRGDVFYLYEEEEEGLEMVGFLPYLAQTYVNPLIESLATDDMDAETFKTVLQQQTPENNEKLRKMTQGHALTFKTFTIQHISKTE